MKIRKNAMIISLTIILILAIITGCFEEQVKKPYSTLPNGTKIYGDHNKVKISDLSIRTQAGGANTTTITFGHWFTPEDLPNINGIGEYNWAVYNITGQIKNTAGYEINMTLIIKFYNSSGIYLFSDIKYIDNLEDLSSNEFQFIINSDHANFNDIEDIEFEVHIK
jgi:hypothetical protein